jgi:hypothetical protein
MTRLIAAAALGLGLVATAAPAGACELQDCSWSAPVCAAVDCSPNLDGCFPIDTLRLICL